MTAQRHDTTAATPHTATPRSRPGEADRRLWAKDVLLLLSELDGAERRTLQLIYWDGLTQAQVAVELRLPEPVVRRCVAHGLRALAARLATAAPGSSR